jgi:hypothetical protein
MRTKRSSRSRSERRSRRVGRARGSAAVALVAALAAGWLVTARMGHGGAAPASASLPVAGSAEVQPHGPALTDLRERVPAGARCVAANGGSALHCVLDGIRVEYRSVPAASVNAVYLDSLGGDSLGGAASRAGSGRPACARGRLDERSWSRISQPQRVAGRYSCRLEKGRAAMLWTVADRGLLVHAVAPDGDLASLFAWWLSHSER